MYQVWKNKNTLIALFTDKFDAIIFCDLQDQFDYTCLDILLPDGKWYDWEADIRGN